MNPVELAHVGLLQAVGIRLKAGPSTAKEAAGYTAKTASSCSIMLSKEQTEMLVALRSSAG